MNLLLTEEQSMIQDMARRFARSELAPIAGFRNILVHEYLSVDWNEVYNHLQDLDDLVHFAELVRSWLYRKVEAEPDVE